MPELSRSQLMVYGAVAVALLLVGTRAIRAEGSGAVASAPASQGSGAGVSIQSSGSDIVVDVAGAVTRPGVYRLPAGSRVVDALARAGGPVPGALLEGINRAARLTDGQQVVVPRKGMGATSAGPAADGPIGLGAATVEQLETIDGIGPVTAQKIIEFRDRNGGLSSIEQLDEVSGIGPATMQSLRGRLQP